MENINNIYSEYLNKKTELEKEYKNKVSEVRKLSINNCKIKKGMILRYNNKVGRVLYVDFIGFDGIQHLQAMLMESESRVEYPINENEFDKVEILEEPNINVEAIKELYKDIDTEDEYFLEEVEKLKEKNRLRTDFYRSNIEMLRKDCIHSWRLGHTADLCTICGKESSK